MQATYCQQLFAMTMLDQHRAYAQIANKAKAPISSISDLAIFGNHSATQFPDISNTKINNQAASKVITDEAWLKNTFIPTVQQRGSAVIKARGLSSAASAANAAIDTVTSVEGLRKPGEVFSVGLCSKGEYGAKAGLIVSYPTVWQDGELAVVSNWGHNDWAKALIQKSFVELEDEYNQVKELGLLEAITSLT